MAEPTSAHITVDAPPHVVVEVLTDLESYPEWAHQVTNVTVLERGERPGAARARIVADLGVWSGAYVVDVTWVEVGAAAAPAVAGSVSWRLREGRALDALHASCTVEAGPGGAALTYRLEMEPAIGVPAFVTRRAERALAVAALDALRTRVEHVAGRAPGSAEDVADAEPAQATADAEPAQATADPVQDTRAPGSGSLHDEREGLIDALLAAGAGSHATWTPSSAPPRTTDTGEPTPPAQEWAGARPLGCGGGECPAPGICHACPVCRAGRAFGDMAPHTLASLADAADLVADGARAVARLLSQTAHQAGRSAGPQHEGNTP